MATTTTTKKELIERIVQRTGLRRSDVRSVIQEFLDMMLLDLRKGHRLEFRDFGVFEIKLRTGRTAQNPRTMQKVTVPPRRTVKFKPGRLMRDSLGLNSATPVPPSSPEAISELKPTKKKVGV